MLPCAEGTELPDRQMSQSETESSWIIDRSELKNCRESKQGLIDWAKSVVQVLSGGK